jgi:hypothetical protein
MGSTKALCDAAFRDFVTDGVPTSGYNPPAKADIRAFGTDADSRLGALEIATASNPAASVWATPGGSAGTPSFRALLASDIPQLTVANLPASLTGAISCIGTWNAATNTPTLTSSTGTSNTYYVVSVGGSTTLNGISSWNGGDYVLFTGGTWQRVQPSALVSGATQYFDNRATAVAASINGSIQTVVTLGYTTPGIGGALYRRAGSAPSHAAYFQSADGAYWVIKSPTIYPEQLGATGDGVTDDSTAMQNVINYAQQVGIATEGRAGEVVGLPGQVYAIGSTLTTTVPIKFHIPYLLYTPTTGACIIFGNVKSYRNWGYDIKIGTVRAKNGNLALPASVNGSGCDGAVFRCVQFSKIEIGTVIAFTRNNIYMDQTNTASPFTTTITANCSIASGTNTLTIAGAAFTANDVGKNISVPGAGAAGATLVTYIASYISATQVTLVSNASTTLAASSRTVTYSGGQQNQMNYYSFGQVAFGGVGYQQASVDAATGAFNDNFVYIQNSFANVINANVDASNDNNNTYEWTLDAPSSAAGASGRCATIGGSYNTFRVGFVNGVWEFKGSAVENRVEIGNDVTNGVSITWGGVLNEVVCGGNINLPLTVSITDNSLLQNNYGVPIIVYVTFNLVPGTTGNVSVQIDLQDSRAIYSAISQYLATPVSVPAALNSTISARVPPGWFWRAKKTIGGNGALTYLVSTIMPDR